MMGAPQIYVALSTFAKFDARPRQLLEQSEYGFQIHSSGARITREEMLQFAGESEVIIAGVEPYDRHTLERLPRLRCICRCGVGTDNIDLDLARQRGIAVFNTPDAPTAAVAELAVTMMLALTRNLLPQAKLMQNRQWVRLEAHLLREMRVGIVGMGRIGRRVAELLRAFGSPVAATDPLVTDAEARALNVEKVELEVLLATSDIVSLHAARSRENPLQLGAAEIGRMKRGAVLVNLARGGMVDENALLQALEAGHLAGAGLDVFVEEPYRGRLCDLDNVILTPHSSTLTVETRAEMELECVDRAIRFLRGDDQLDCRVA